MSNGQPTRPQNVPLVNTNADALDLARGITDRSVSRRYRRQQFSGLTGEQAARDYVRRTYGNAIKREIHVPRRTWGDNPPILDVVFELDNGEYVVVEAKAGGSPLGVSSKDRYISDVQRGLAAEKGAIKVRQFTPEWFEERLTEIAKQDRRLANRIRKAWADGKLTPLLIRLPMEERRVGLPRRFLDVETDVIADNLAEDWNRWRGVQSQARPPTVRTPAKSGPITDPGRLLAAGHPTSAPGPVTEAGGSSAITDVERGLETAERRIAHAPSAVSAIGKVSSVAKRASGVRSAARVALAIGTKAWRATRTIGNVVIHILLPLTPLDLAIEFAMLAWDLWNLADDVEASLKKGAFEAVGKQRKTEIESEIEYKILDNQNTLQRYMRRWDEDPSFSGFLYARVMAEMISDNRQRNFVQKVTVSDTYFEHATELTHNNYRQVQSVTSVLKYTMYPPYLTPFDILLTKVTNLFIDTLYFAGTFNNDGEGFVQRFSDLGGIRYNETYDHQYEGVFEFSAPLVAARCEYCLKYLHWAAGRLSQHAVAVEDLEGNLENPEKGLRRRHAILLKLYEGKGTGQNYSGNFARFADYLRRLVKDGSETPESRNAMAELYLGARAIWNDLERIERNKSKPEYFYYGPNFKPGR